MGRHRGNDLVRTSAGAFSAWALLLMLCAGAGCDPQARYRTLSFFFDGVPEPRTAAPAAGGAAPAQSGGAGASRYIQHGPYAARLCEGCHAPGGNKLIMRIEELCIHCHVFDFTGKKIHGPLASGGCTACHDPHGSINRFLLVSEARVFCLSCHDERDVRRRDVHGDASLECTDCHDAHSAPGRYLLK